MTKKSRKYIGSSPLKFLTPAVAQAGASIIGGYFARRSAKKAQRRAEREQQARLEQAQPFLDNITNEVYENPYASMENVYEDATIDRQSFESQRNQYAQIQADTIQGLRGAGGSAGIASLAAAMARQGAKVSEQNRINIANQERKNQDKSMAEAQRIQKLNLRGEKYVADMERQRNRDLYTLNAGQANMFGQAANVAKNKAMTATGDIVKGFAGLAGELYGTEINTDKENK